MSWNTSAILLKGQIDGRPEDLFDLFGFPGGRFVREISFDEAGSKNLPGRAFAMIEDWTVIFDPGAFGLFADAPIDDGFLPVQLERQLAALSRQAEVFAFMLAGASDTAAFARFAGGARVRCLLMQQGAPAIDIGSPDELETRVLAEEPDMESAVFLLAEELGFDLFGQADAQYSRFAFPK